MDKHINLIYNGFMTVRHSCTVMSGPKAQREC